jgi:PAS domain S-box-containing protein
VSEASVHGEIQARLLSEAMLGARVGFLVWDDDRRYIAVNDAACEILGATREEILGHQVGGHSVDAEEQLREALRTGFSTGRVRVNRFDGSGEIEVLYITFATKTAGMPFMGTVIARVG